MAYVVRRRGNRFEIRESIHTADGPRARTLANFSRLTAQVLARAEIRSKRPFASRAVVSSARRAGAPVERGVGAPDRNKDPGRGTEPYRQFVESSRRMALAVDEKSPQRGDLDPGEALIDLLGFAEQVRRSHPPQAHEPLRFPPMARLVERRRRRARPSPR